MFRTTLTKSLLSACVILACLAPLPSQAVDELPKGTKILTPKPNVGFFKLDDTYWLIDRKEVEAIAVASAQFKLCQAENAKLHAEASRRREKPFVETKNGQITLVVGGVTVGIGLAALAVWGASQL